MRLLAAGALRQRGFLLRVDLQSLPALRQSGEELNARQVLESVIRAGNPPTHTHTTHSSAHPDSRFQDLSGVTGTGEEQVGGKNGRSGMFAAEEEGILEEKKRYFRPPTRDQPKGLFFHFANEDIHVCVQTQS